MIGGRLTMRAALERNSATASDSWGGPVEPVLAPVGTLPCFVWSNTTRDIEDGRKNAVIEDVRGLFALDADIREGDELASVTDRRGKVLIAGRLRIEGAVQHKHTHLEANLRRVA